jgi:hypothetical protein
MTEHSINRSGTEHSQDDHADENDADDRDDQDDQDEQRSEAETKRELRGSVIGEALLRRNRELKDRQERR